MYIETYSCFFNAKVEASKHKSTYMRIKESKKIILLTYFNLLTNFELNFIVIHRIISCPNPPEWRRKPGRPHLTWLRQMDGHFQRLGTYRMRAWALAGRDPKAYRNLGRDVAKHLP